MLTSFGVWMILLAIGATFELYDDDRPIGLEHNFNYDNYDYQDLEPYRPGIHDDPVQDLMLYHLFNTLQNKDDARLGIHYRPQFSMLENPLVRYGHVPFSELMDLKGVLAKRISDAAGIAPASANTNGNNVEPANQEQSKPKNKNIRKLPYWVCYLKVCSFRRPPH